MVLESCCEEVQGQRRRRGSLLEAFLLKRISLFDFISGFQLDTRQAHIVDVHYFVDDFGSS